MFLKDFDKFKCTVENAMASFFNMTPAQVEENIKVIEQVHSEDFDLDNVDFKDVNPEFRNIIMKYRTLKYFSQIYNKVLELDNLLKEGQYDGRKI